MSSSKPALHPTRVDSPNDDEELAQLEHATPGPWNDTATEGFGSPLLKQRHGKPSAVGATLARKPLPKRAKPGATNGCLPVLLHGSNNYVVSPRGKASPRHGRDSSPVATAYNELVAQTRAMEDARATNTQRRLLQEHAFLFGIEQLSAEHLQAEKESIRFNALKNEVDIFQQYLDPFVFEMRTPREHGVNSSVYRHFIRMQGIQDMGIPIYSLGAYEPDSNDKILLPRTFESFYRRIRRRDAADFIDASLITCPLPHQSQPRHPKSDK